LVASQNQLGTQKVTGEFESEPDIPEPGQQHAFHQRPEYPEIPERNLIYPVLVEKQLVPQIIELAPDSEILIAPDLLFTYELNQLSLRTNSVVLIEWLTF